MNAKIRYYIIHNSETQDSLLWIKEFGIEMQLPAGYHIASAAYESALGALKYLDATREKIS